jgi:DNA polymerase-3 subunit delta'
MSIELSHIDSAYPWLMPHWQHLTQYIRQERYPQALLISGVAGLGKRVLAETFAARLLCSTESEDGYACGECHRCQLLKSGHHPDFICLKPEEAGKDITIDAIRSLIKNMMLKPHYEEAQRIVLIDPADHLNAASANAFLKYLEEPTERTLLILISSNPACLPATIRSRCQKLHLPVCSEAEARQWLTKQGVEQHQSELLKLANGAPLAAKILADASIFSRRNELFNALTGRTKVLPDLMALALSYSQLSSVEQGWIVQWMIHWVTDLIRCHFKLPQTYLLNSDQADHLKVWIQGLKLTALFYYYDFLLQQQRLLSTQVNKQLLFEELFIKWNQLIERR